MLEKIFIGTTIEKVRASEYNSFETIQLLFETFFNILNNKRDIKKKNINIEISATEGKFLAKNSILY